MYILQNILKQNYIQRRFPKLNQMYNTYVSNVVLIFRKYICMFWLYKTQSCIQALFVKIKTPLQVLGYVKLPPHTFDFVFSTSFMDLLGHHLVLRILQVEIEVPAIIGIYKNLYIYIYIIFPRYLFKHILLNSLIYCLYYILYIYTHYLFLWTIIS